MAVVVCPSVYTVARRGLRVPIVPCKSFGAAPPVLVLPPPRDRPARTETALLQSADKKTRRDPATTTTVRRPRHTSSGGRVSSKFTPAARSSSPSDFPDRTYRRSLSRWYLYKYIQREPLNSGTLWITDNYFWAFRFWIRTILFRIFQTVVERENKIVQSLTTLITYWTNC